MVKHTHTPEKIAALDNAYTKEQYAEFQKQLMFRRRRLAVVFIIAFAIFTVSGMQLIADYHRLNDVAKEKKAVIEESAVIDEQVKLLKREVSLLKDEDYVLKLARSRYYFSKEGEQIYALP